VCCLRHYLEQGLTKTTIAEKLGVSRRTVYHWIKTGQLDRDLDAQPVRYAPRTAVLWKLDPYKAIGHPLPGLPRYRATMGISPYAYQGQASVWIGDGDAMVATVTTTLTGSVKQGNPTRGAQVLTTSHDFDFGGGDTFVTEDIARLIPMQSPGVFRLLCLNSAAAGRLEPRPFSFASSSA
jgi:hypothetical protein